MATPDNIARFNRSVLGVLAFLHEQFPKPAKIHLIEMTSRIYPEGEEPDSDYWKTLGEIGYTIDWLEEEGFLRYEKKDGKGDFLKVRLTQKGLTALGLVPKSLNGKKPIIERAKAALESGSEKAAAEIVKALLVAAANGVSTVAF